MLLSEQRDLFRHEALGRRRMHSVIARENAVDRLKIYSRDYYDRIRTLEDQHWWHAGMREIAAALLCSEPEMSTVRVLDAGCGTGSAMGWVRTAAGASSVTGIDVSAYVLSVCRDRGELSLSQSSVMELPFRDGCFDLVLCNDVFNVCTGVPTTVRGLVEGIVASTGGDARPSFGERPYPSREVWSSWGDPSKAARMLGWTPRIALGDGLRVTIDWFRKHAAAYDEYRS